MKLVKLDGSETGDPVWVNPELVAAVEFDGQRTVLVIVGCANPIKVMVRGTQNEVANALNGDVS